MSAWNPQMYLRFKEERTKPSIDLVSHIDLEKPKSIIDIGCGPGNSTAVLHSRWPTCSLLGLDSSPEMIAKARAEYPDILWQVGDAAAVEGDFDLLFSNAALQWIPNHDTLIPALAKHVKSGGVFAAQIPMFHRMPLGKAIDQVACQPRWSSAAKVCAGLFSYHDPDYYYRLLLPLAKRLEMWETYYYHVLESQQAIIDFVRPTGLRPYLDALDSDQDRMAFEAELLRSLAVHYPVQPDGKVLFPFQRLFYVAYYN